MNKKKKEKRNKKDLKKTHSRVSIKKSLSYRLEENR